MPAIGCVLAAGCCLLPTLLVTGGCNAGKQTQHDLYSRELRLQEDEIYRLEDCLEEYQAIVKGMRKENAELRSQLGGDAPATRAEPLPPGPIDDEGGERSLLDSLDWSPERPASPTPTPTPPPPAATADDGDVPGIELPAIDGGEPADAPPFVPPSSEAAPLRDSPAEEAFDAPPIELPPSATPDASPSTTPATPQPLDAQPVDSNPLEELLPLPAGEPLGLLPTGDEADPDEADPDEADDEIPAGAVLASATPDEEPRIDLLGAPTRVVAATLSAKPGPPEPTDEPTIVASVQPRSADGRVTLFQGDAALLVRDPARPRKQAVLGRWQFTASEVASAWTDLADEPRFLLPLVLPETADADAGHELWIRLTDGNGNRVLAKTMLPKRGETDPTGDSPARLATPTDAKPLAAAAVEDSAPFSNGGGWKRKSADVMRAAYEEPARESPPAEAPVDAASEIRVTSLDAAPIAKPAASVGDGWTRRGAE